MRDEITDLNELNTIQFLEDHFNAEFFFVLKSFLSGKSEELVGPNVKRNLLTASDAALHLALCMKEYPQDYRDIENE